MKKTDSNIVTDYLYDWEYWITPEGKFPFISPSCERITNYKPAEFEKNPSLFFKIIHPEDKDKMNRHFLLENSLSELPTENYRIIDKKGEEKWIRHHCRVAFDHEGNFIGRRCSNRDITELVHTQEEMKQLIVALRLSQEITQQRAGEILQLNKKLTESEARLKDLIAAKDKFFSIIAHDLKSPLVGFLGLTKMLSQESYDLSREEVVEMANAMYSSAQQLFKLLENLLSWSRIQRGVITYNPEKLNLRSVVEMTFGLYSENAKNKKIKLLNTIDENLSVYTDLNFINTVLNNLVSNAVKFTQFGGEITIAAAKKKGKGVEIMVADNGVGMDEQTAERVFRLDGHITTIGTANEVGTGLGLILCKELIERSGSSLTVKTKPNEGSTFIFSVSASKQNSLMKKQIEKK